MKKFKERITAKVAKVRPAKRPVKLKPTIKPIAPLKPPQAVQTRLPMITNANIFNALTKEWQTIKHLIFKLKIKDMMDARFLQIKLKELERKGEVLVDIKIGKKHWKLK